MRNCRIIDADGHFTEPRDMWPQYLDKRYRDMAPRHVKDSRGRLRMVVGGQVRPYIAVPPGANESRHLPGGFDPHARIQGLGLNHHARRTHSA